MIPASSASDSRGPEAIEQMDERKGSSVCGRYSSCASMTAGVKERWVLESAARCATGPQKAKRAMILFPTIFTLQHIYPIRFNSTALLHLYKVPFTIVVVAQYASRRQGSLLCSP